jgi:hypothetical protein
VIPQQKKEETESEDEDESEENEVEEQDVDGENGEVEKSLWDEEEDKKYIQESQMKQLRRKGIKPLPRREKVE